MPSPRALFPEQIFSTTRSPSCVSSCFPSHLPPTRFPLPYPGELSSDIFTMGSESNAHHGENITPAVPQPNPSSTESFPTQKPMGAGVDTKIPWVTWRSLVLATFVSMGGILFGYDTGQISGFQEMDDYLERYGELNGKGEYTLSNVRAGLLVGLLSVGTLIGSLLGAPVADFIGRKWSITVWCVVMIVGLIVQISSPSGNWVQMVVARWVTGLGVGGCSLVVPMYQGESAPRHIRGAIICCYQLFVTLGIFLSYCINLGTEKLHGTAQWRITLGLTFLFALVLGGGIIFFPESPRFDYRHGRAEAARRTMSKLYGIPENHNRIIEEMDEIREQLEAESAEQKWHEFITAPRMFYRICLGMVLQSLQQLTGANYFFYYVSFSHPPLKQTADKTRERPSSKVPVSAIVSSHKSSSALSTSARPLVVSTSLRTLVVASRSSSGAAACSSSSWSSRPSAISH